MIIDGKKIVSVSYTLSTPGVLSTSEETVVEKTEPEVPLVWLYGAGSMIPDFEKNLQGKKKGDHFDFRIKAEDGYGLYDDTYIANIPLDAFRGKDGTLDTTMVKLGNTLPMMDNQGNHLQGVVKEISLTEVKMDFNHPMAGKDLHFVGEVEDVRLPSPEEIEHGHVHGPGGHHHH
jgi:FKBP-type peptidyl-prolyl cis-trans isomerase SlyD